MKDTVYDQIDRLMPVLFAISLLAMLSLIIRLIQRMRSRVQDVKGGVQYTRRYPSKSMTLFIASIIAMMFLSTVLKEASRNEIRLYLDHVDPKTLSVTVNGGKVADSVAMITVLRSVQQIPAHHSHTVTTFPIAIDDQIGQLNLLLGRDSEHPQEYWVYYPRYRYTEHNEVYRINTSLFDGIK